MNYTARPLTAPLLLGVALCVLLTSAACGRPLHKTQAAQAVSAAVKPVKTTETLGRTTETLGGGTLADPASGPPPSFGLGGPGMVLVKNWRFGTNGTIKNYADMSASFVYHDQYGNLANGTHYGAVITAPTAAEAVHDGSLNRRQPVEGVDCPPARRFTPNSLRTFVVPLNGAATLDPNLHNAGCGSFMAKWNLPRAGSLLGRDIVWETRVRYVPPPYFWFALWSAGNKWKWDGGSQGAEADLVESFGYDNGGGNTNYDGRYWHSDSVAHPAKDAVDYGDWGKTMAAQGVKTFDAAQYHTWTWVYRHDNSFAMYCDGKAVQSGTNYYWTFGNTAQDEPIDLYFLFDGGWGHTQVASVDHPLPASAFAGKFYEWSYSRVYLSRAYYASPAPAQPAKTHAKASTPAKRVMAAKAVPETARRRSLDWAVPAWCRSRTGASGHAAPSRTTRT